jgi:hypothetical protein
MNLQFLFDPKFYGFVVASWLLDRWTGYASAPFPIRARWVLRDGLVLLAGFLIGRF